MGAIIGKVAVVAPGNHFEKCVRVSVCIVEHAACVCTFTGHYRPLPSRVSSGEKVCCGEEEMPGDYCAG